MSIPLVDLKAQYLPLEKEIQSRIQEVLRKMNLFLGENVQALEKEFATLCGARYGVGVGSGTDALHLALRALGIGPGDEVITVSHTFFATAEAIVMAGARPVFVDIDPHTYTLDPAHLENAITHRTRAIVPVHLYGHPADMDPILDIARSRALWVIEDACQAHSARHQARPVGSIGDVGCFSFYFSKNLGAYGEAGILVTNHEDVATNARMLRDHGSSEKYVHPLVGFNARLDELQAAILRVKLPYLEKWNNRRRELATLYNDALHSLPLVLPTEQGWAWHVYHLYVVRTPFRDPLLRWLHSRGIMAGVHYPVPVHQQPPFRHNKYRGSTLHISEKAAREVLSLPIYPEMEPAQVQEVAEAIHDYFATNGHQLARQQRARRTPLGVHAP